MLLDDIAAYWDSRADGYSQSIHEKLTGEAGFFFEGILWQALPEGEGLACLDMGCGPGFFTLLLGRLGHYVISADYSPEMLERTRRNCAELGFEAHTVRADAQSLPFEDGRFDFVCSRNLLWDLENPEKAYSEWLRVLKPGRRLLMCDGNHYLYYYREDYRRAWEERTTRDTRGVDPTQINEIARELPLSRQLRPEWDVETIAKLGFREIQVRRVEQQLTYNFILSGVR